MISGEEEAHEHDTPAERRARRAWLGDAVLLRRAETAEASVRTFEAQLAERELELRRVKQREHAEQRLRVEAEEATARLRRTHRAELDRLQRRAEEAHAAVRRAERQRGEIAAQLAEVGESCERLRRGVDGLQGVAAEVRGTLERDHRAAVARIHELERERARARAAAPTRPVVAAAAAEGARREEMADALTAAVERLRARPQPPERPATESPEVPVVYVVPRLFPASAGERQRLGRRLAPTVRRLASRLAEWAERTQSSNGQSR